MRLLLILACVAFTSSLNAAWKRHTIDNTSSGADGVRLKDINKDGLMDIATGWEEGGLVRIYLHPGKTNVKQPWPSATVGHVKSPEDAVFADIDGNGIADVISSCEGKTRSVFVHWAPDSMEDLLDSTLWRTEVIPSLENQSMWMFCKPEYIDDHSSLDLVVGSKGANASVGWLEAPDDARQLKDWKWHPIYKAGWIMSIMTFDADQDGDQDILVSDRKGTNSGVLLLENRVQQSQSPTSSQWIEHRIGPTGSEVLFLDWARTPKSHGITFWVAVKPNVIWQLNADSPYQQNWDQMTIEMPHWMSRSKAVRQGDIDLDGHPDLVVNCESASDGKSGMAWLTLPQSNKALMVNPAFHDIAGPDGIKFDRIELLDLDEDGDLDVMTCEERENLGVIWYENPSQ
ncbi:MAG: VCBS repeat-containing protein [Verrucomicrobia bacterium]|jgi:hypothetical protein|nr:VCBS repeat-containing protein [Verrucomicrobiota bacterium]